MQLDNQNSSNIPWYRARWFWGVVIGSVVVCGIYIYIEVFYPSHVQYNTSTSKVAFEFLASVGGGFLITLSAFLLSAILGIPDLPGYPFLLLHFILISFLLYKTFKNTRVNIVYPATIVLIMLLGHVLLFFLFAIAPW